jgi:hypothetical protein
MGAVSMLADRVASLIPSTIPENYAAAVTCSSVCFLEECNDGDFFVSGLTSHCCFNKPNVRTCTFRHCFC